MVVNIDSIRFRHDRSAGSAPSLSRAAAWQRPERMSQCVTIGLVNNMAGAAFKATERQFISLLDLASEGIPIHVSFYTLPGMSRAESGGHSFARHYASVEALRDTHLDGLIVTGREPKMANLRDEPYWESFTEVLEWARNNTYSTVWSCLAAHAAILHMDGIDRRKSETKNFGVFECAQVSEHHLMQGLSPRLHVPHSRWNGVVQKDLIDRGYGVLTRTADDGVDAFFKREESLFVFFQGHLEYESDTLMREYRRDVGRFVKGETSNHPLLPHGYFDRSTEKALMILRDKAIARRGTDLLTSVAAAMETTKIENTWQRSAVRIYRNWLEYICARKSESQSLRHTGAGMSMSR
jgi:homoserine O-succinyltransferase